MAFKLHALVICLDLQLKPAFLLVSISLDSFGYGPLNGGHSSILILLIIFFSKFGESSVILSHSVNIIHNRMMS